MYCFTANQIPFSHEQALDVTSFSMTWYESIKEITAEWDTLVGENVFLRSPFLSALEEAPISGGTVSRYLIIKEGEKKVGVLYFQIKKIDLYESLRMDQANPKGALNKLFHRLKCLFVKPMKANLLVCGNMTLTGENGYSFTEDYDDMLIAEIIDSATKIMVSNLRKQKIKARAILIKDYYSQDTYPDYSWSFTRFSVQPNMILRLQNEWNTFDDYLNAMKSKYRVRVRRAKKKGSDLEKRILPLEEIHQYSNEMSHLYRYVAEQADFNLFFLPENYFYTLQKYFGNKMKVLGYFVDDKMVGFSTYIKNHNDLDAHFLGYDPVCNSNCQLYLNMLYDLVDAAIIENSENLILSRTAMEIKSSVGAEAKDMHLYIKLTNPVFNMWMAPLLRLLKPDDDWTPRSPFK